MDFICQLLWITGCTIFTYGINFLFYDSPFTFHLTIHIFYILNYTQVTMYDKVEFYLNFP